ncbi:hypothetical protein [Butyrivibrio sp. YAB3001]|uniref:hypothetical protein n=1 Tax=Butyrivibrio sp. YAB3001 TaxID=1520812 RepID=UPI0008F649BA|nr:hypothetical protein [Butyrivibrio sp. YAB3001]SFB69359.1 hypothetical protein SAMN02910398_00276 [Butyrivibrio sp. YAB3001]
MSYPDYYPKQMKFRNDLNENNGRRSSKRPGSYQPAICGGMLAKDIDSISHVLSLDDEDFYERLEIRTKLTASISTKDKNKENTNSNRRSKEICNFYKKHLKYENVSSRIEITKVYNSNNTYIVLIDFGNKDIGCVYDRKSYKYRMGKKTEDLFDIIYTLMSKHFSLKNKTINIICNDKNGIIFQDYSNCIHLDKISKIASVMYERKYSLVFWQNDDINVNLNKWIASIDNVKKL